MSTEKPKQSDECVNLFLNPLQLSQVHLFREQYSQWKECKDATESQVLVERMDELAFKVACSVALALDEYEAAQTENGPPRS